MGFVRFCSLICVYAIIVVVFSSPAKVTAGDIVHDDDSAPKKPGCENDFVLVLDLILHISSIHFDFLWFLKGVIFVFITSFLFLFFSH